MQIQRRNINEGYSKENAGWGVRGEQEEILISTTNINKFLHTLWNAQNDADGSWICGLLSQDLPACFTQPDWLFPSAHPSSPPQTH